MRVRAGKLRHVGDIQHFVQTGVGDRGQPLGDWRLLTASVPLTVEPLSGKAGEVARQLVAQATHTIKMRYHAGVQPLMRVVVQGRYFNVGWVDEGDFRRYSLELLVIEQQTGAT